MGGVHFGIRSTSDSFGSWAEEALAPYRVSERAPFRYSMIGAGPTDARRRGFNLLLLGSATIARTTHLPTIGRALIAELDSLLFRERDDALFLPGVAVVAPYGVVLVPSVVAMIMSKHVRRALRAGLSLGAPINVALDPSTGRLIGLSSALEVDARAPDALAQDRAAVRPELAWIEGPTEVDAILTTLGADPGCDTISLRSSGPPAVIEPVSPGVTLHRLASSAHNLTRLGRSGLEALATMIDGSACFDLQLSLDPESMIETIRSCLAPRAA